MDTRKIAVILLRVFAALVLAYGLSVTVFYLIRDIDDGLPWHFTAENTLSSCALAVFYAATLFALSWIVSLVGKQYEINTGNSWLNNRKKAISLLKKSAILIVFLSLLRAGGELLWDIDRGFSTGNTTQNILWDILPAVFQGCVIFALAWVVSLMGESKADEATLDSCEDLASL